MDAKESEKSVVDVENRVADAVPIPVEASTSTIETVLEKKNFNGRALKKSALTYELETFQQNILLIFNQKEFINRKPRKGTEFDVIKLRETFSKFGFLVKERNNLTHADIMAELKEFSDQDFTEYGCVAVAVLTHGAANGLIRAKDKLYNENEIIKHFNVDTRPTLVTKPKIVIIQACRGKDSNKAVKVFRPGKHNKKDDDDEECEPYTLPVEADMLVLHSSYMGKSSYRDKEIGSWFIQTLCSKIDEMAMTDDLDSILTEVKRVVAIDLYNIEQNTTTKEEEVTKQMPVITSTLIRKFYFRKYGQPGLPIATSNQGSSVAMDRYLSIPAGSGCQCFLDRFVYIRNCLKYHLEQSPNDNDAQMIYNLAIILGETAEYNEIKQKLLHTMCQHLKDHLSPTIQRFVYL